MWGGRDINRLKIFRKGEEGDIKKVIFKRIKDGIIGEKLIGILRIDNMEDEMEKDLGGMGLE